jgi:CRP-like cAMP-binding protein
VWKRVLMLPASVCALGAWCRGGAVRHSAAANGGFAVALRCAAKKAMQPTHEREPLANRILLALPEAVTLQIAPLLEYVTLNRGELIDRKGRPVDYIYFVNRGLISLIKTMQDGRTVEIGAVGIEGITNPLMLFGIPRAALETIVQIPGTAYRMPCESLHARMDTDTALRVLMENYARFSINQLAQTAACNRLHTLEERCCRWLLTAHDSALSDTFPLTHEFLAMMLGAQRSGVTIAARILQKGLIEYRRGVVTITNRTGLEEAACECYGAVQKELGNVLLPRTKA